MTHEELRIDAKGSARDMNIQKVAALEVTVLAGIGRRSRTDSDVTSE
jgi:hypothetical protein